MLAKGSYSWIIGNMTISVVMLYFSKNTNEFISAILRILFIIGVLNTIFFLIFFRDPKRSIKGTKHDAVSPADGKVIYINGKKMSIFMNIHNVHVNRAPLSGKVIKINYKPGGFIPAFNKDSKVNERNHIVIKTDIGLLELTQIAGVLTRRIVSYISEGNYIKKGERIGMIRFGSRVDITVPDGYEYCVKKGEKVKAGETIIATNSHFEIQK